MKDLMTSVGGPTLMASTTNNFAAAKNEKDGNPYHLHHHHHRRPVTPETLPVTASSSSASFEESLAMNAELGKYNAPSSVCQQRKLSAAIVTSPDASIVHDFVEGRPKVTIHDLNSSSTNSNSNSNLPLSSNGCCETPPRPKQKQPKHKQPKQKRHSSVALKTKSDKNKSSNNNRHHHHHDDMDAGGSAHHHPHPSGPVRQHSVPINATRLTDFVIDPPAVRVDAWSEAPATSYNVRGATYLDDHKKVPSEESLFSLLTLDLIQTTEERPIMEGLCHHPNERIQRALRREQETGERELPEFIFAVNLAVPGPPVYHLVAYFGCDDVEALKTDDTPLGRIANKFFFGDCDEYRDNVFKLIPRIVEGNFVVKKAVGSKPTILGRKLKQHYIRHPRFLELIVDIGSDSIARNVVGLSMGYARSLIVDMMFLLEATEEETLPERILGGVRLKNLCFKKRDGQRKVKHY